jgi:hypothetical protein
MKTAVEKIIAEIDNEVDFLKTHHYIPEVRGRMIGLAFAKRVSLELKEMEKEQKGYTLDDVKNALHSVELKDNKNYSKIWEGMENCFELIKQQKA